MHPRASRAASVACVVLLAAAAFAAVVDHQRMDSPTLDEPYHVFAGSEYVADGTFWINLEHPPLAKLLAGLALGPLALEPPSRGLVFQHTPHNEFLRFVYANRAPADRIVAAGRRPFPWLLVALVFAAFYGARALWGKTAGPLAAALVALDPSLVAHAGVVHTDVPAALTMTVAVVMLSLAARQGSLPLWSAAGLALGLALATKFTAVLLVPLVLFLPLLSRAGPAPAPRLSRGFAGAAAALATSFVIVYGVYAFAMRRMDADRAENAVRTYLTLRKAAPEVIERHAALSRLAPPLGHYAAGLRGVALFSERGRGYNFFHGRAYEGGYGPYFFVVFLIKSTPAFLLFLVATFLLGRRDLLSFPALALLLPAALVFLSATRSSFNIGQRHLLPIYPLLAITGAGFLAKRLPPRVFTAVSAGLTAASGLSLLLVHPYEFSYFNLSVGGLAGGKEWVSDSNVDWGQDMKRLAVYLRERGIEESTTVVAYSGLATNYYSRRVRLLDADRPIGPERYAIGATMEALGPYAVAFLEGPKEGARVADLLKELRARGRRIDHVGGSLTIWDLPP